MFDTRPPRVTPAPATPLPGSTVPTQSSPSPSNGPPTTEPPSGSTSTSDPVVKAKAKFKMRVDANAGEYISLRPAEVAPLYADLKNSKDPEVARLAKRLETFPQSTTVTIRSALAKKLVA